MISTSIIPVNNKRQFIPRTARSKAPKLTFDTRKALLTQRGTRNSGACLNFERPVKQNQLPKGARRPAAKHL